MLSVLVFQETEKDPTTQGISPMDYLHSILRQLNAEINLMLNTYKWTSNYHKLSQYEQAGN